MSNYTFPEIEQYFGSRQMDIIKKRGTKAAITDYAILCGGYVSTSEYVDNNSSLEGRTGWYWTKSDDGDNDARAVSDFGHKSWNSVDFCSVGARPALPFSSISKISTNGVSGGRSSDGVYEVEFGYYPQRAVSKIMQDRLNKALKCGKIQKTNNVNTTDLRKYDEYSKGFQAQKNEEYEYNGKRYVRIKANFCSNECTLSNGEKYQNGDYVWVEVEPVKWLVDEKEKLMITEKIIFAGVQFNRERNYKTKNFNKTDIKSYLDNCFSKELIQSRQLSQDINLNQDIEDSEVQFSSRIKNPYDFKFDGVSEEEIIKGAVQSGIAVFLHGRSSEGKSARVKQLDPDCEIIYLGNATLESFIGKSIAISDQSTFDNLVSLVQKGTMSMEEAMKLFKEVTKESKKLDDIKPTWLEKLEAKCEKEKDKIHIVFLDELTNALPSIQGMAFNLVLDRELNGKWKLPENARIVAAGNDYSDSLAANEWVEPLFNRFAHVYIETTVESWLKWATTPKKSYQRLNYENNESETTIHPSIIAYIAYKYSQGEDVLRTPYNGKTPNADPRKWEMASKILCNTKQPEMLRALVGEEITADFTEFCKQQVISVEDVLNGNYTSYDLEMNWSQKYATAVGLSTVDDKNIGIIRDFIKNKAKMGEEVLATFEELWIHGDEKRADRIAEFELMDIEELKGGERDEY